MELLLAVLAGWVALSVLGVLGAAAVCRAGHAEDVARGFVEGSREALRLPAPRTEQAAEVTRR